MENIDQNKNREVEKLSILNIQKQEVIIDAIKNQIEKLEEVMKFYEGKINSPDISEEDRNNYLKQVEQIKIQIKEYAQAIEGLEKAIQILSSSILQNTNISPNSKAN